MSALDRRSGDAGGLTVETFAPDRADDVARIFNAATADLPYCGTLTVDKVRDLVESPSYFDPQALLIAYRRGRPVAYAHGAFGRPLEGSAEPNRQVGNIRGLFFPPDDVEAGRVVLDEVLAYLVRSGAVDVQGWGSFAGYLFYRGLYMGTEPVASATHAHVIVRFVQAGFAVNQHSIFLARPLEAQVPSAQAQPPAEFEEARFVPPTTWEADTWLGLEPRRTSALRGGQQVGQIIWSMLPALVEKRGHAVGSIAGLSVSAECRRQGIAKALVLTVMRACYQAGAREITVATTQDNTAALNTYYACGFTEREILLGHALARKPQAPEG